ncbi:guanine nucleotide exchange factor MSS4 [Neocloeon triangulifer]|uniref:guanine nucleotide exchange factor MSS4 n=1 Tax=Neocloeon triangulifer TaxID=2078957 RepID=UPI00286F90B3|nr:guanine nucleotide exchange factor MSS4 [Neocloeon triangulifer]
MTEQSNSKERLEVSYFIEAALETEVSEDGKNKHQVKCQRCPSLIMKENIGAVKEITFDLPSMKKKDEQESGVEQIKHFWMVPDMFQFENVGFSNTVGNVKFLTCADCEIGPIGWHDLDSKNSYVALNRVNYGD